MSQRVGPWTLLEFLDKGGNAKVWKALRGGSDAPVALKLIHVKKKEKEQYQRFIREIKFLREHDAFPGILPLLDAHLPENPSAADRPWLSMPIATPITKALTGRPLTEVVSAMADVAETLFQLHRQFNIAHRDIKPGNLYELNGSWLIGDFGLVALPDAEELTRNGQPLGPAHFTAHEMVVNPATADPHPADVFSMGKTLWVLATGQRWPPDGHQPVATRGMEIGDYSPHSRSSVLDQEIDFMTRFHPEERPTKEQVALDLVAWSELAKMPAEFDVSQFRNSARLKLDPLISEQSIREEQRRMAEKSVRRLQELTKPLNEGLQSLYPSTKIDFDDAMTRNIFQQYHFQGRDREVVFKWQRCTLVAPYDGPMTLTLRMGRHLALLRDGSLFFHTMIHVGPEGVAGTEFHWSSKFESARVGSAESEKMLEDGILELSVQLKKALEVFIEKLPNQV